MSDKMLDSLDCLSSAWLLRLPKYAVRVLMGFVLGEIMGPATFAGPWWNGRVVLSAIVSFCPVCLDAGGWAFLMAYTGVTRLLPAFAGRRLHSGLYCIPGRLSHLD